MGHFVASDLTMAEAKRSRINAFGIEYGARTARGAPAHVAILWLAFGERAGGTVASSGSDKRMSRSTRHDVSLPRGRANCRSLSERGASPGSAIALHGRDEAGAV